MSYGIYYTEYPKVLEGYCDANKAPSSQPPVFNSFGEMFKACFASWANKKVLPAVVIPWQLQPTSALEIDLASS
jgi:hypothetical protein